LPQIYEKSKLPQGNAVISEGFTASSVSKDSNYCGFFRVIIWSVKVGETH